MRCRACNTNLTEMEQRYAENTGTLGTMCTRCISYSIGDLKNVLSPIQAMSSNEDGLFEDGKDKYLEGDTDEKAV